jgi:hypothetical protein
MKKIVAVGAALVAAIGLSACSSSSDVASKNLSKDADNYKVFRQIVVYNAITDKYVLEVDGWCSLGNHDSSDEVTYTCKIGNDKNSASSFIKDIIKKSDNTFVFVHQLHPKHVSTEYYKVILKPTEVLPNFEVQ